MNYPNKYARAVTIAAASEVAPLLVDFAADTKTGYLVIDMSPDVAIPVAEQLVHYWLVPTDVVQIDIEAMKAAKIQFTHDSSVVRIHAQELDGKIGLYKARRVGGVNDGYYAKNAFCAWAAYFGAGIVPPDGECDMFRVPRESEDDIRFLNSWKVRVDAGVTTIE